MANRIRKDDEVVVIAGKDKGKRGNVLTMLKKDRIVVEGVNVVTKHVRPDAQRGTEGGRIKKEMPIHISNVMLVNPQTGKGDRVGFKFLNDDNKKVRYFKSDNEVIDID